MRISIIAPSQFALYADTDGDFGSSLPANSLEWLTAPSHSGTCTDTNNVMFAGTPFYANIPVKIASQTAAGTYSFNYDYVLRVAEDVPLGLYSSDVVYTVVAQ